MNRIRDANAGTNRNGVIVLNDSHEGLPVRHISQPILEAAAKKMGIVVADRHGRRAWQYVSRGQASHSSRSRRSKCDGEPYTDA